MLQSGFLRMSGRLPDAVRMVPPPLWRHLGEQFAVGAPGSPRPQPRRDRARADDHGRTAGAHVAQGAYTIAVAIERAEGALQAVATAATAGELRVDDALHLSAIVADHDARYPEQVGPRADASECGQQPEASRSRLQAARNGACAGHQADQRVMACAESDSHDGLSAVICNRASMHPSRSERHIE